MSLIVLRVVVLAVGWCLLVGSFSLGQILIGMLVGTIVLRFCRRVLGDGGFIARPMHAVAFVLYVGWELVVSSFRVVWDVLTPTDYARPRIIAVPVEGLTPVELTLLANSVSLTPGSLSLDVSRDGKLLYVHAMYAADPETVRASIVEDLAVRVRSVCRRRRQEGSGS